MERVSPIESDQESSLLQGTIVEMTENVRCVEPSQKLDAQYAAVTPMSPKLRSKAGSGSISRSSTKKPTTLPNETVEYLKAWMMSPEHIAHPYPTEAEKAKIMEDTGLELKQLTNWFVNNRKRYWKPRVEAHLLKDQDVNTEAATTTILLDKDTGSGHTVAKLEKCENGIMKNEKITDTPSPLRVSRRKGQKGKSYFIENMAKPPFVAVTPNSHSCSTNAHVISGHNSLASQSDGTTSCSDSDDERCPDKVSASPRLPETNMYETIDIHILRPLISSSTVPDLTDVTVLSNVPPERILKTYSGCALTYNATAKNNVKSNHICFRRDAEIVRLKKHHLSMFLAEQESTAHFGKKNEIDDSLLSLQPKTSGTFTTKRKYEVHIIPTSSNEVDGNVALASKLLSPRPKYRRRSIDVWKEACQTANHVYDDDELPSLEEATRLFGYAN